MKLEILLFGNSNLVNTSDIVGIEEKTVTFNVRKSKKNPKPKPSGFFAKLAYSEVIYYDEKESYTCLVIKVKGGTQMRGKVDENGNFSGHSNQLYDFYTVYNDKNLIKTLEDDEKKTLEVGNFYAYPGILNYSEYTKTNMLFDESVKTKKDFVRKYLE